MIRETFRKFANLFTGKRSNVGPALSVPDKAPRFIKDPKTHHTRLSGAFGGIVKVCWKGHTNPPDKRAEVTSMKGLRSVKAFRRLGVSKAVKP